MTNWDSRYRFDFRKNWVGQPMERDYYLMRVDGSRKERLTYFNDPTAPEYLGHRALAVASDVSPDGRYLASTIGVDFGTDRRRDMELKICLIELQQQGDETP